MGRKNIVLEIEDYELHELHEGWMGRKNIVLKIEDYELLEWHECRMGRKNIVLKIEDYELHEWSECELRGYLCGGISVITPLPAGEGTGEGPAVVGWLRAYHLVCYIVFIRCLGTT